MVSILMSVFKEPIEWIKQSIESVLAQSYTDFEFIIINDNPNREDLKDFLEAEKKYDKRIKIFTNVKNIGLTKSLNYGLNLCKGKYIARMDADDISLPRRIEKQVAFLEKNTDVIVCGTNIEYFGKTNVLKLKNIYSDDLDIRGQMLLDSGFAHPSVMIRREVMDNNSIKYDEDFRSSQDYKLWYDLSDYGKFANLSEVLLLYRLSPKQISKTSNSDQANNRQYVSKLFRDRGINGYRIIYDRSKRRLDVIAKPKRENQKEYRTIKAYYLRSYYYDNFDLTNLLEVVFSKETRISIKERFIILMTAIRRLL